MKITIKFNIEDPEDDKQLKRMLRATDMASVLHEIVSNLQKKAEWECENLEADSDPTDGVYVFRRLIGEELDRRGIIIDDLID